MHLELTAADVKIYERTPVEKILERSLEAEILFTNKTPLREDILSKLPSLRYIGVLATGSKCTIPIQV